MDRAACVFPVPQLVRAVLSNRWRKLMDSPVMSLFMIQAGTIPPASICCVNVKLVFPGSPGTGST